MSSKLSASVTLLLKLNGPEARTVNQNNCSLDNRINVSCIPSILALTAVFWPLFPLANDPITVLRPSIRACRVQSSSVPFFSGDIWIKHHFASPFSQSFRQGPTQTSHSSCKFVTWKGSYDSRNTFWSFPTLGNVGSFSPWWICSPRKRSCALFLAKTCPELFSVMIFTTLVYIVLSSLPF